MFNLVVQVYELTVDSDARSLDLATSDFRTRQPAWNCVRMISLKKLPQMVRYNSVLVTCG